MPFQRVVNLCTLVGAERLQFPNCPRGQNDLVSHDGQTIARLLVERNRSLCGLTLSISGGAKRRPLHAAVRHHLPDAH